MNNDVGVESGNDLFQAFKIADIAGFRLDVPGNVRKFEEAGFGRRWQRIAGDIGVEPL